MENRTHLGAGSVGRLLDAARERLREFGITLEAESPGNGPDQGADAIVTLSRDGVAARYMVQAKAMTLTAAASRGRSSGPYPVLLIGDRVSRRSAEALREANIQFVDALGNAFIAFDGVFVDTRGRVRGDERAPAASHQSASPSTANLFSRGRAQVILALLVWPELIGGSQREIAAAAGTSLGQAHDALTRLRGAGFLLPGARGLIEVDRLVDYWTAAYPTGLGPRLDVVQLHGDPDVPVTSEHPVYLSGETADGVDVARPATLTVYLDSWDARLAIANRWSANPDRVRNIFVRHKFWTSPHPDDTGPEARRRNAPWPLVYADLLATGDARLAEVAGTWRDRHVRSDQG